MIAGPRHPLKRLKTLQTLRVAEVVMAVDKPAPARQAAQALLQHRIIARIGDQPEIRKGR